MKKIAIPLLAFCLIIMSCSDDDSVDGGGTQNLSLEDQTLELINNYRNEQGLSSLSQNDEIAREARSHSEDMANGVLELGHDGFDERTDRLSGSISFSASAENVAFNQGASNPAQQAVDSWLNSPGHLANIEEDHDLTGIGIAQAEDGSYYFTQIFLRSN